MTTRFSRFVLPLIVVLFTGRAAVAQATSTASKRADIAVFGAYSSLNTAYYGTTQTGFIAGIDYTIFPRRFYLSPSLELRGSISPLGSKVGERVYSGGLKVEHEYLTRFHPYADLLIGAGTVHFNAVPQFADNSVVLTYGGGIDVDLFHDFSAKVDVQGSHWNLGDQDIRYPSMISVGLLYHIHFRDRYRD